MDKNKIYELLYNKSEILQKRLNRIFLFLFVFPLIYFLLDNSFVSEVKTPLISIDQTEIILLTFPIVYAILLLLIVILSDRITDIKEELDEFESHNNLVTKRVMKLLSPVSTVADFANKVNSKGFFGCLGVLLIYAPIIIFCLIFPFVFFGFTIYDNFTYAGEFKELAVWSSILALWTFIATIVKLITAIKENQISRANTTANNGNRCTSP
ncbi:hypothetical protein [uncultured Dokdonia sp.]|uniref:hypothetical protein n=1 Tax=uncultured Dokdonia sp. TaxID=575653 RepID=UPI002611D1AF|nr:hypothetical protein [uncultured Dokdonia sp.]